MADILEWLSLRRLRARVKRLIASEADLVPPTLMIMIATVLSKILGMLRNGLYANKFGTGPEIESFVTAIQVPDLLTSVFVLGAFSSAFIPVFARYLEEGKEKEAWKIADVVTTLLFLILIGLSAVIFLFAPLIVRVLVDFDVLRHDYTVEFLRIMLISPILLGLSNVLGGVLRSHHRFTASAFAPVFYNVGMIAGVVWFVPLFGTVWGLGSGVIMGALLHVGIQILPALRLGFHWRFDTEFDLRGARQVFTLAIPRMFGMAVAQVDMFVDKMLAGRLAEGSIIKLNYANTVQNLPVGIFGIALATACFPIFVRKAAHKTKTALQYEILDQLKTVLFFTLPIAMMFIILRVEIVRVLFGLGGSITWIETREIAFAVGLYAVSITAQSVIFILNRAFYALQDTQTSVIAAVIAVVLNTVLSLLFVSINRHFSMLALSFTVASLLNVALLAVLLYAKIGMSQVRGFLHSALATLAATLAAGLYLYLLESWLSESIFDLSHVADLFLELLITIGSATVVYLVMAAIMGAEVRTRFRKLLGSDG